MTLERTYTIPLRRKFVKAPKFKRANKAVRAVREFLEKHMKSEEIQLGQHLNHFLWKDGIRNPPGKVTITATKGKDGIIMAELEGKKFAGTVKPEEASQEPQGLKEKLQSAIGGDDKKAKETVDEKPEETAKKEEKK